MANYGQGMLENPAMAGRFNMEDMTEEEIYAMSPVNSSTMSFAGNYVPHYTDSQINTATGYSQLQMSDYSLGDNRYLSESDSQAHPFAKSAPENQLLGGSSAQFQNWSQPFGNSSMPQAPPSIESISPWAAGDMSMPTSTLAEYSSPVFGTSPTYSHSAAESSASQQEGSFRCEVEGCGKLFTRSYNYKAHLETHDERREYPFQCLVGGCDKKFARKTDLQRHHQSVHMKERNHGCAFCGRFFARKDTLRRHMEDGCSKRFDIETIDLSHTLS